MAVDINYQVNMSLLESLEDVLSAAEGVISALPNKRAAAEAMGTANKVRNSLQFAFEHAAKKWEEDVSKSVDKEARTDTKGYDNVYRHLYDGGNPQFVGSPDHRLFKFTGSGEPDGIILNLTVMPDMSPSWSPVTGSHRKLVSIVGRGMVPAGEPNEPWPERARFAMGSVMNDAQYSGGIIHGEKAKGEGKYVIKPYADRYFFTESFTVDYSRSKARLKNMVDEVSAFNATQLTTFMDRSMESAIARVFKTAQENSLSKQSIPYGGRLGPGRTRKGTASIAAKRPYAEKYGMIFANEFNRKMEGRNA